MSIDPKEIEKTRLQTEEWLKTATREELRGVLQITDPSAKDIPVEQSAAKLRNGQVRNRRAKKASA